MNETVTSPPGNTTCTAAPDRVDPAMANRIAQIVSRHGRAAMAVGVVCSCCGHREWDIDAAANGWIVDRHQRWLCPCHDDPREMQR